MKEARVAATTETPGAQAMSLKAFHLFFISVSALMCFGIGAWEGWAYSEGGTVAQLARAVAASAAGLGLIVYAVAFLRKTRNISMMAVAFGILLVAAAEPAWACAVCYGDPNSKLTQAMSSGILVLLGVTGTLLSMFAGLFCYWALRTRRLRMGTSAGHARGTNEVAGRIHGMSSASGVTS